MHYSSGVHYGATGSSRPASQTAHSVSAVVSQWQLSKRFCERDVFRSNVPLIQISVGLKEFCYLTLSHQPVSLCAEDEKREKTETRDLCR